MIDAIKSSPYLGDPRDDRRTARQYPDTDGETAPPSTHESTPTAQPDVRLVIEQDEKRRSLTYKQIDRATGEVVSVVSREDLLKIGADPSYASGKVIDTKA